MISIMLNPSLEIITGCYVRILLAQLLVFGESRNVTNGIEVLKRLLSQYGAETMLLNVLKDHDSSLSPVTKLAAEALVKLLDVPEQKIVFINGKSFYQWRRDLSLWLLF